MKIICKHNGLILDKFGYDDIFIDDIEELTDENRDLIISRIQWRPSENWDFEYGIGGFVGDEYFSIKDIKFSDNKTKIIVKVTHRFKQGLSEVTV